MVAIYRFAGRDTIKAEARQWLINLDGGEPPSAQDIAALREWANRSPAHRQELERIAAFWDDANILALLSRPRRKKLRIGRWIRCARIRFWDTGKPS